MDRHTVGSNILLTSWYYAIIYKVLYIQPVVGEWDFWIINSRIHEKWYIYLYIYPIISPINQGFM